MGFPTPTTYGPRSRDVYEEGLMLPCVRIQKGYKDVPEVIDICRANIRVPDQFYGDYLAVLAAVRTGESRLKRLCAKYGWRRSALVDGSRTTPSMARTAIASSRGARFSEMLTIRRPISIPVAYPSGTIESIRTKLSPTSPKTSTICRSAST